jgi:N-glycosylase/DNA lyase
MPYKQDSINELKKTYKSRKSEISERLMHFKAVWDGSDKEIFSELCFCILTPQSKAVVCDDIINNLKNNCFLFEGSLEQIKPHVKRARFYKNKSKYIVEARKCLFKDDKICIKDKIDAKDTVNSREWLVKNIKGIGYKEASHFLRNIGMGDDLAILDIHILRNLKRLGVINTMPKSLSKKMYLEIEERLKEFSRQIKIPMAHLDLLFWSMGTGRIFK